MVRINSLYSLEIVMDYYYISEDLRIVNNVTKTEKKISINKRGYPYVTLETRENRNIKVPIHKIVALAFIKNAPYELIEHIDDDKMNYAITNLKFSNHKNNARSASKHGLLHKKEAVYRLSLKSGEVFMGTIKELVKLSSIPKGTLYDNYYTARNGRIKEIVLLTG